jgi:hypothetical protein
MGSLHSRPSCCGDVPAGSTYPEALIPGSMRRFFAKKIHSIYASQRCSYCLQHWDNQHRATPEAQFSQVNWSCSAAALALGTMPHASLPPSSSISASVPSYSTGTSDCPAREDRKGSCLPFGSSVITRVDEGFSKSGPYREAFASHLAE